MDLDKNDVEFFYKELINRKKKEMFYIWFEDIFELDLFYLFR